jgi:UDP-N-acetylmuramoyl-L-alanyl-D-glutamate--2,6-diaminopimelate ligase
MNLGALAGIASDSKITGFALDHRKVAAGNVFGAFRGTRFNGEDFIAEAVRPGSCPQWSL